MESSPIGSGPSSPRFTEDFNASPSYQHLRGLIQAWDRSHDSPIVGHGHPYRQHDVDVSRVNSPVLEYTVGRTTGRGLHRRLSDKEALAHPSELVCPLPETVRHDYEEKEVAVSSALPEVYEPPSAQSSWRRKLCGIPKRVYILVLTFVTFSALALGIGLGVGLGDRHPAPMSPDPELDVKYLIGGAIDPQYYSTFGAFNGSGIALAQQSFANDLAAGTQGTVVLYFQHWTGQIRWQQLSNGGQWLGGDVTTIVATDAKNGTPLSAVSYASNGVSTWHVFYINENNTISQKLNSNVTNVWVDGPITAMRLPVLESDEVGMQACWYGNDYGDSDYIHTPIPGQTTNSTSGSEIGIHIWYASDSTTFQQYGWRVEDNAWVFQREWPGKNGHAGVGCYSWGPGTVTYVMFVNLQNTVEFWWKDTNTNLTNTTSHPINEWVNSSVAVNNVYPSSALGFTNYFYVQMADDRMINGYNISWAAENSTIVGGDNFTVAGNPGLPGTHLSVTAVPAQSGGNEILVFYQTNGSDVTEYTRDLIAGQWSNVNLPIPKL